jgi:hypothetical protein
MTKFKILKWALKLFISLCLFTIAVNIFILFMVTADDYPLKNFKIGSYLFSIASSLLLIIGLFFIHQSITFFIRRGYFNLKSASHLKKGGYILAVKALLSFLLAAVNFDSQVFEKANKNISFVSDINANLTLLTIGFALIAVSDIIKKGNKIKQENDLTI